MALPAQTLELNDPKRTTGLEGSVMLAPAVGQVGAGLPSAANEGASSSPNLDHTQIKSNFVQSPSTYWALTVPLLSARYIAEGVNKIVKLIRRNPSDKPHVMKDSGWALSVGAGMMLVTGYYTNRTYGDMKRQFSEPLGWEFDKPPEEIGLRDMLKSKNEVVHNAVRNFIKRSILRGAVDVPFFAFLVPKLANKNWITTSKSAEELADASVSLGVGANAMYLAGDALGRKKTFFEELQHLIEAKINHTYANGELVTAQDLINLYDRQGHKNSASLPLPKMNTPEWNADLKIFERMADLMNQSYGNTPKIEYADFTVPKLIYLEGMDLLMSGKPEQNLAYVEIANRYGIPAVKKLAESVKNGADFSTAIAAYPVNLVPKQEQPIVDASTPVAQAVKAFASDALKSIRPDMPLASHGEKITQSEVQTGAGMRI